MLEAKPMNDLAKGLGFTEKHLNSLTARDYAKLDKVDAIKKDMRNW
jgi:hypothetical protein